MFIVPSVKPALYYSKALGSGLEAAKHIPPLGSGHTAFVVLLESWGSCVLCSVWRSLLHTQQLASMVCLGAASALTGPEVQSLSTHPELSEASLLKPLLRTLVHIRECLFQNRHFPFGDAAERRSWAQTSDFLQVFPPLQTPQ